MLCILLCFSFHFSNVFVRNCQNANKNMFEDQFLPNGFQNGRRNVLFSKTISIFAMLTLYLIATVTHTRKTFSLSE